MGALCVANKSNLAVKQVAVKCKIIPFNGSTFTTYFKSICTFKEIKYEISKKIKKDRRTISLEINGKVVTYENLQLSHIISDKFDEIEIKVLEASNQVSNQSEEIKKEKEEKKSEINANKFNSGNSKISSKFDHNNLDEQAIYFLTKTCDFHQGKDKEKSKLTQICQTCSQGICGFCQEEIHKDHKIIRKIDIIEFNKSLSENQLTLNNQLIEMKLDKEHTEIIKNYRLEIKKHSDGLYKMIDEIKKKENELIDSFKQKIDNQLPFIMCYRDNLNRINSEYNKNLNNIISDDKIFMQYYLDYLVLNNQLVKSAENINSLKLNLSNYSYILEDYQKRTNYMSEIVKESYEKISKYMSDDFFNKVSDVDSHKFNSPNLSKKNIVEVKSNPNMKDLISINNSKTNIKQNINRNSLKDLLDFQYKNISGTSGINNHNNSYKNLNDSNKEYGVNLRSIMQAPTKTISNLIKKKKPNTKNQQNDYKINSNLDIISEYENNKTGELVNQNFIYNLEEGSSNIFIFNCKTFQVTKQLCKLNECDINKFETHLSYLNYNNKFYVSGSSFGVNSTKSLLCLDIEDDFTFKKLPDMISSHSFHGMLGVLNSVWVISGSNSTKVEKFNIDKMKWVTMPSLHYSRTWPSSIYVENLGVFVFGGSLDIEDQKDNTENFTLKIEKLENKIIKEMFELGGSSEEELDCSKWEIIKLNFDQSYLPIFSGFLYLPSENLEKGGNILIFGGKSSMDDYESEKKILNLNLENFIVKEEPFSLAEPDEFDGRMFVKFIATPNENQYGDGNDDIKSNTKTTYYAQFSSFVSKRVHLYSNNKIEIVECEMAESSFN